MDRNSQHFVKKINMILLALRCFYVAIIHRKYAICDFHSTTQYQSALKTKILSYINLTNFP